MEAATTAAMEAATTATMEATTTMKSAATCITAAITKSAAPVVRIGTVAVAVIAVSTPSVITVATSVVAVIPRPGADKETACKPLRPIVSIRRARIWVVSIIAIGACWGCADVAVTRANADADTNSNRSLCVNRWNHEDA
jgi:hypothetical protein